MSSEKTSHRDLIIPTIVGLAIAILVAVLNKMSIGTDVIGPIFTFFNDAWSLLRGTMTSTGDAVRRFIENG
jgi:hypothetical protein